MVKSYTRRSKTGKRVTVKSHARKKGPLKKRANSLIGRIQTQQRAIEYMRSRGSKRFKQLRKREQTIRDIYGRKTGKKSKNARLPRAPYG